jgi:hypothetical protein
MKRTRIIPIYLSLFFVLCFTQSVFAGFEGDVYKVSYECRDTTGKKRWQATVEIRNKAGDIYTITEKFEGFYFGFDGKISWIAVEDFKRTKDFVRPINMDQHIFNESGKMIATQKQYFNYTDNSVTCVQNNLINNTSSTKKFKFTKDIVNRLLQGLYVQKFLENGQASKEIQLLSPGLELYDIELRVVGREEIEINGRKRDAYKLCFDPMLGLFNLVKIFLPKAYVWHSAEPLFELLKYQGIETSVNSPEVVITALD